MRLLTWNMNHRPEAWARVRSLAATEGVQVALLQEAPIPPSDFATSPSAVEMEPWAITAPRAPSRDWRSVVAVPDGNGIATEALPLPPVAETDDGHLSVVHPGQMAIAEVRNTSERLLAVSLYGIWEWMKPGAQSVEDRYAVPSVHRAISDLTRLMFQRPKDTAVVAGDLNIWRGEGTWRFRYQTVFDRFEAEGFAFAGPFGPDGSSTVPTYAHRGDTPRHQTDFVFVKGAAADCTVLDDWTPSDHGPIVIDVRWPMDGGSPQA